MTRLISAVLLNMAVAVPAFAGLSVALPDGPLRLAEPLAAPRAPDQVYLVQLAAPPVVAASLSVRMQSVSRAGASVANTAPPRATA